MYLYLLIPFICFCFHFFSFLKGNKLLSFLFLTFIALFLCGGLMTGTDWRSYEIMYNNSALKGFWIFPIEKGFLMLMLIFKTISLDFWVFLVGIKLLSFYIFYRTIKYLESPLWLSLGLSFPFLMYLLIDNPLRNLIAISIFLFSIKYLYEKKPLKYMGLIILAAQFHISALILLLIYPLKYNKIKSSYLVLSYVSFFLIFSNEKVIKLFMSKLISLFPGFFNRMNFYLSEAGYDASGSFFSLRSLIVIGIFLLMIHFRKKVFKSSRINVLIFSLTFFYLIAFRLGLSFQVLTRFTYYFFIFYVSAIIIIGRAFVTKEVKQNYWFVWICITLFSTYSLATVDYRYIPYTNYFIYSLNGEIPTYHFRADYNPENSPYERKIEKR
jgi:hypothetical protein